MVKRNKAMIPPITAYSPDRNSSIESQRKNIVPTPKPIN